MLVGPSVLGTGWRCQLRPLCGAPPALGATKVGGPYRGQGCLVQRASLGAPGETLLRYRCSLEGGGFISAASIIFPTLP